MAPMDNAATKGLNPFNFTWVFSRAATAASSLRSFWVMRGKCFAANTQLFWPIVDWSKNGNIKIKLVFNKQAAAVGSQSGTISGSVGHVLQ